MIEVSRETPHRDRGAFVLGTEGHAEMKCVFVDSAGQGKGIARVIMAALEREAALLGVTRM